MELGTIYLMDCMDYLKATTDNLVDMALTEIILTF